MAKICVTRGCIARVMYRIRFDSRADVCLFVAHVVVRRGCMSSASHAYNFIRQILDEDNRGCVKRMRRFDCFAICSSDGCN